MDPAGTGALIGIGIMAFVFCTVLFREKTGACIVTLKKKYQNYKHQQQPLLPVTKTNPILVRLPSKQFQMKELLPLK